MTITSDSDATRPTEEQSELPTIEIGCPNCGSRYRLPPPTDGTAHRNSYHFHCTACDALFTTHPTRRDTMREQADSRQEPLKPAEPTPKLITPQQEAAPLTAPLTAAAEPPAAPTIQLWPWLTALLLTVAATGGWVNQQQWSHSPLAESIYAWWAPQRSIGWQILQPRAQWVSRQDAPPLLAIGIQLHNGVLFDRLPPPLLLTTHTRGDSDATESQLVALHHQPSLQQMEQTIWQPPSEDRTPIHAGTERNYTIILDHPPKLLTSVELTLN
ncbi:MAG: hypothetical protein Q9M13_07485 [Mariprofundales bacterium]|nr:hypothetical protein [Mariprofundales bacterium]